MNIPFDLLPSAYGIGAVIAVITAFLMLKSTERGELPDAITLALYIIPSAIIGARTLFVLVRYELLVEIGPLYVFDLAHGGYLLWGAVLGGAVGAAAISKHYHVSAQRTLDRLVCPALIAIAIFRAFEFFTLEGRGYWLDEGSLFCAFPIALQDEYGDWQLAVFVWESVAALLIMLRCMHHDGRDGDRTLVALIFYSACQVVFESLRMDSSPRFGFVRVSQLISGIVLLLCIILRSYREISHRDTIARALGAAACVGIVVGLEFAIDKSPLPLPICYALMVVTMIIMLALGLMKKKPLRCLSTHDATQGAEAKQDTGSTSGSALIKRSAQIGI